MKKMILAGAAALSVLAFPVAFADARSGGRGGSHGGGGAPVDQYTPQPPSHGHKSKRCKRTQAVGFVAKGSMTSFTADTVTLDVKRANRHARKLIESAGSEFTLGNARVRFVRVTDGNGDNVVDFADVLPTDKVVAIGKAVRPKRGCEGDTVLKLRKIRVIRRQAEQPESSDQS